MWDYVNYQVVYNMVPNAGPSLGQGVDPFDFETLSLDPVLLDRQQKKHFANSTLFALTAQSIFKNKRLFDHFERTQVNPFDQISNMMRVELIERRSGLVQRPYIKSNLNMLMMLMNVTLYSIAFRDVPFSNRHPMQYFTDAWLVMTEKCPDLQQLYCSGLICRYPYFKLQNRNQLDVLFNLVLHFKQLQVLEMPDLECDNCRFDLLVQYLPNLRVLNVELGENYITSEGIATLAKLEHLEEFMFTSDRRLQMASISSRLWLRKFFKACLILLPWLHISGSRKKFKIDVCNFPTDLQADAFHNVQRRLPSQLGLRQLGLRGASGMPVGVALPNLESLHLVRPETNFHFRCDFPLLEELVLLEICEASLQQLLSSSVGQQLRRLSVVASDTLHVDELLRKCPRLRTLHVPKCPKQFVGVKQESIKQCNSMTELGVVQELETGAVLEAKHLLHILQAVPNLRILHLHNATFTEEGGAEVCSALEKRSILQQLEQFFYLYDLPMMAQDPQTISTRKNCFDVLQKINHCCPKLTTFKQHQS